MDISELPEHARDAFYITIGLGVLATRTLQERRQQLLEQLDARIEPLRRQLEANLPTVTPPRVTMPTITRPQRLAALDLGSFDVEAISSAIEKVSDRLDERTQQLDQRFAELEARVDGVLDRLEDQLPDAAREVVSQARGVAKEARGQLRTMVTRAA